MDKKFEIGDRVRSKFYGVVGTITEIDTDGYILKPDTDDDMWIADTDVEPHDPKTAFLLELKGLLEKYDAEISAYAVGYDGELDITFNIGNVEILYSEDNPIFKGHSVHSITADNIMDYDKEWV